MISKYMAIGMVVLVALLAGAGFLLKRAYAANGALENKLASANKIIEQHEIDKADNARVIGALNRKLSDTETKVITVTEKVYAAPVTRSCADSPAMRAASDGLRSLFRGDQADSGRQPAPAVPGPDAGTGKPK